MALASRGGRIAPGCRVRVLEGRRFEDFGEGDAGTVERVDEASGIGEVRFDGGLAGGGFAGGGARPVAMRNLGLKEPRRGWSLGAGSRASSSASPGARPSPDGSAREPVASPGWDAAADALPIRAAANARALSGVASGLGSPSPRPSLRSPRFHGDLSDPASAERKRRETLSGAPGLGRRGDVGPRWQAHRNFFEVASEGWGSRDCAAGSSLPASGSAAGPSVRSRGCAKAAGGGWEMQANGLDTLSSCPARGASPGLGPPPVGAQSPSSERRESGCGCVASAASALKALALSAGATSPDGGAFSASIVEGLQATQNTSNLRRAACSSGERETHERGRELQRDAVGAPATEGSRALTDAVQACASAKVAASAKTQVEFSVLRNGFDEMRTLLAREGGERRQAVQRLEEQLTRSLSHLGSEQAATAEELDSSLRAAQAQLARKESQLTTMMGEALDRPLSELQARLEVQEGWCKTQARATEQLSGRLEELDRRERSETKQLEVLTSRVEALRAKAEQVDSPRRRAMDSLQARVDSLQEETGRLHDSTLLAVAKRTDATERKLEKLACRIDVAQQKLSTENMQLDDSLVRARQFDSVRRRIDELHTWLETLQAEVAGKATRAQVNDLHQVHASSMKDLLSRWDLRVEAKRRALAVESGATVATDRTSVQGSPCSPCDTFGARSRSNSPLSAHTLASPAGTPRVQLTQHWEQRFESLSSLVKAQTMAAEATRASLDDLLRQQQQVCRPDEVARLVESRLSSHVDALANRVRAVESGEANSRLGARFEALVEGHERVYQSLRDRVEDIARTVQAMSSGRPGDEASRRLEARFEGQDRENQSLRKSLEDVSHVVAAMTPDRSSGDATSRLEARLEACQEGQERANQSFRERLEDVANAVAAMTPNRLGDDVTSRLEARLQARLEEQDRVNQSLRERVEDVALTVAATTPGRAGPQGTVGRQELDVLAARVEGLQTILASEASELHRALRELGAEAAATASGARSAGEAASRAEQCGGEAAEQLWAYREQQRQLDHDLGARVEALKMRVDAVAEGLRTEVRLREEAVRRFEAQSSHAAQRPSSRPPPRPSFDAATPKTGGSSEAWETLGPPPPAFPGPPATALHPGGSSPAAATNTYVERQLSNGGLRIERLPTTPSFNAASRTSPAALLGASGSLAPAPLGAPLSGGPSPAALLGAPGGPAAAPALVAGGGMPPGTDACANAQVPHWSWS